MTEITANNEQKPKKKPLKRHYILRVEIGPYLTGERERYASWFAQPAVDEILCVVQENRRVLFTETFKIRNPAKAGFLRSCSESEAGNGKAFAEQDAGGFLPFLTKWIGKLQFPVGSSL